MPDEHPERQVHGAHAARPAARDGVPAGGPHQGPGAADDATSAADRLHAARAHAQHRLTRQRRPRRHQPQMIPARRT